MSSKQDLKALWLRVSSDISFRARFLKEPVAAAACLGIALNAAQAAAAEEIHQQVSSAIQEAPATSNHAFVITLPGMVTTPRVLPYNR